MASSSLRNAVKRKTHKERSQPAWNARLGLLEKHKDYVLRARDFNAKQDRLQKLKLKAALRNPDEFYFKMNSTGTKDGIHDKNDRSTSNRLTAEEIKGLKTQDLAYLQMKKTIDTKKAERLQENLHFVTAKKNNKHTIFVDNADEVASFDPVEHFDTVPELVENAYNRPRKSTLRDAVLQLDAYDTASLRKRRKIMDKSRSAYQELYSRLERAKKLENMRETLDVHRKLQGKGKKIKIKDAEDGKPPVYKWRQQRQR